MDIYNKYFVKLQKYNIYKTYTSQNTNTIPPGAIHNNLSPKEPFPQDPPPTRGEKMLRKINRF